MVALRWNPFNGTQFTVQLGQNDASNLLPLDGQPGMSFIEMVALV